jgi:hypothetical protein
MSPVAVATAMGWAALNQTGSTLIPSDSKKPLSIPIKIGAVLESFRAPTFTVVSPQEEVRGIPIKIRPKRTIRFTLFFIIFLLLFYPY